MSEEFTKFDSGKDWTFDEIESVYGILEKIVAEKYGITYYPNQLEIITSEQMLDAYAAVGMPTYYSHWSFGKQFIQESEMYKRGRMGLAYEIVINSSPCIAYLMEENTITMQALVIAHAAFGHNSFFKNNVHFKQWTDAEAIIDYLVFAKTFIAECEEKYGSKEVEKVLDAAHALRLNGIDRYKRPATLSKKKVDARKKRRDDHEHERFVDIWRTVPLGDKADKKRKKKERFPKEPEENVLYFIEKNATNLDEWKRELIRIVRKIAQYFYPQMMTKIMNEGWATFWHYTLMNDLYDQGYVTDGFMLEFLDSHTGVIKQQPLHGINPYALGFAMFQDIKRIAMEPTEEDKKWFHWAGNGDWLATVKQAAYNFKDESFILQYLSPKVIRDMQLFYILDDDEDPTMVVNAIQNDEGYSTVREKLAEQQNINNSIPYIQVTKVDVWGDRSIEMEHTSTKRHELDEDDAIKTLSYLTNLWGYPGRLITVNAQGKKQSLYEFDPNQVDLTV
ncbi:MAG: SpoVR family protein [Candidatus Thorarchaeota archaeon]|nr:MAG: SpoVR family protein [Candidatus Thorarchaeota archaeon]